MVVISERVIDGLGANRVRVASPTLGLPQRLTRPRKVAARAAQLRRRFERLFQPILPPWQDVRLRQNLQRRMLIGERAVHLVGHRHSRAHSQDRHRAAEASAVSIASSPGANLEVPLLARDVGARGPPCGALRGRSPAGHTAHRGPFRVLPASARSESGSVLPGPAADRADRSLRWSGRPRPLRGSGCWPPSADRRGRSACRPARSSSAGSVKLPSTASEIERALGPADSRPAGSNPASGPPRCELPRSNRSRRHARLVLDSATARAWATSAPQPRPPAAHRNIECRSSTCFATVRSMVWSCEVCVAGPRVRTEVRTRGPARRHCEPVEPRDSAPRPTGTRLQLTHESLTAALPAGSRPHRSPGAAATDSLVLVAVRLLERQARVDRSARGCAPG